MRFNLSTDEVALLENESIPFMITEDYDDDAALELLDKVRDAQVEYAQREDASGEKLYSEFERIADKIYKAIPS